MNGNGNEIIFFKNKTKQKKKRNLALFSKTEGLVSDPK